MIGLVELNNRMWYRKTYHNLISRCREMEISGELENEIIEIHHIIPKSIWPGGVNVKSNLIKMPIRYHMMAHLLLSRAYPTVKKLARSAFILVNTYKGEKSFSTKTASIVREVWLSTWKGENHPSYGKKHTEEEKRHLSEVLSGKNSYWYGKHLSQETRDKLREANLGKKASDETKQKLSKVHLGKKQSPEHVKARIQSKMRTYKHHSQETKDKISKAHLGKKLSKDHVEAIRRANSGGNNPNSKKVIDPYGRIWPSPRDCAKEYNMKPGTLRNWIRKYPDKGFKYL